MYVKKKKRSKRERNDVEVEELVRVPAMLGSRDCQREGARWAQDSHTPFVNSQGDQQGTQDAYPFVALSAERGIDVLLSQ